MARRKITAGNTSNIVPVFIQDSSSTTGAGLGSLVYNSAGLTCKYKRRGASSYTSVTLVTATVGTFTSGGFKEDTSGQTGSYELHIPDAAFASGARWVVVELYGAANMVPIKLEFELDSVDYQNSTSFGLSRLDLAISTVNNNAASAASNAASADSNASAAASYAQQAYGAALIAVNRLGAIEVPLNATRRSLTINLLWSDSYDAGNGTSNIFISSVRDDVAAGAEQSVSLTPIGYTDPWTSGGLAFNPSNDQQWRLDIPDELFAAGNAGLMGLRITSNAADDFWLYFRFVDTVTSEADAILAAVGAIPTTGNGDITVDHNYGGLDALRVTRNGQPIDNAIIKAYVAEDYDAGEIDPRPATTITGSDGRWIAPLQLDADTYHVDIYDPATKTTTTKTLEVT